MNKIEIRMCGAVLGGYTMSKDGTRVLVTDDSNGEFHNARVTLRRHEIAHYYYHLSEGEWVIRLTDDLVRTPVVLSRLDALIKSVVKGGKRNTVYKSFGPSSAWAYKLGASRYNWEGTHLFIARSPKLTPIGVTAR